MAAGDSPWDLVGERVRAARVRSGMTVRELARRIGVSASHISQVERGIGAFSVPALYTVAHELGVSMHELLDPPDEVNSAAMASGLQRTSHATTLEEAGIVQRAAEHPSIKLSAGPRWSRLTAVGEDGAEFLEVVYAPGATGSAEYIRHDGREYGVIITGTLNVEVDGRVTTLAPGDSIVFDSTLPHRFWNESTEEVRAVWFVRDRPVGGATPHG